MIADTPPTTELSNQPAQPDPEIKILHVKVPIEAWLNARKAALDSRMKFNEFITEQLYLATPFEVSHSPKLSDERESNLIVE